MISPNFQCCAVGRSTKDSWLWSVAQELTVLRAPAGPSIVRRDGNRSGESRERKGMLGKKHLRGVSSKEQREYEHIKESAQRSGRYGDRAKEVAARTVLKKHKAEGHSKGH